MAYHCKLIAILIVVYFSLKSFSDDFPSLPPPPWKDSRINYYQKN